MRLRIVFSKNDALRYTGHLDLHRLWERTARRAGLPLLYSQGFHPQPKIQIAAALPLGFAGRAEMVDMWLEGSVGDKQRFRELLQAAAPAGLTIQSVEEVGEGEPALQRQVIAAEYEVVLPESRAGSTLERRIEEMLRSSALPRQRRGRPYDLRPLILRLERQENTLRLVLSARGDATGRPEEVLAALGIPFQETRIERTRLIFENRIE